MQTPSHKFATWLEHARRGDQYIYHIGFLAKDVQHTVTTDREPKTWTNNALIAVAAAAWKAMEADKVRLFQKKLKPYVYQYIAVRS